MCSSHCHCETSSAPSLPHLQVSSTGISTNFQPGSLSYPRNASYLLEESSTPSGSNTRNHELLLRNVGISERRNHGSFNKHNAGTRRKRMEVTLEVQGRGRGWSQVLRVSLDVRPEYSSLAVGASRKRFRCSSIRSVGAQREARDCGIVGLLDQISFRALLFFKLSACLRSSCLR